MKKIIIASICGLFGFIGLFQTKPLNVNAASLDYEVVLDGNELIKIYNGSHHEHFIYTDDVYLEVQMSEPYYKDDILIGPEYLNFLINSDGLELLPTVYIMRFELNVLENKHNNHVVLSSYNKGIANNMLYDYWASDAGRVINFIIYPHTTDVWFSVDLLFKFEFFGNYYECYNSLERITLAPYDNIVNTATEHIYYMLDPIYIPNANEEYNNGYLTGLDDGEENGYNVGYDAGIIDGYNSGFNTGYSSGYLEGSLIAECERFFCKAEDFFKSIGDALEDAWEWLVNAVDSIGDGLNDLTGD